MTHAPVAVCFDDASGNTAVVTATNRLPVELGASATIDIGDVTLLAGAATIGGAFGFATTCTTSITRPTDTNSYIADDVWSDSTSAPTAGGFTLTSAARISGGSGILTDVVVVNSVATALQAELWIFDSAVTAVNDNATFALSDGDALKLVGIIPFTTAAQPSNAVAWVTGLDMGFQCVGTANLRYLVKVKAGFSPGNAEILTVRAKIIQTS